MNNYYKLLQVINVLIEKYDFIQISIKEYTAFNDIEAWLRNENDENYKLIRVSLKPNISETDIERIESYLDFFRCPKGSFLNITICNENDNKDLVELDFASLNIEKAYASSFIVFKIYPEVYSAIKDVNNVDEEIEKLTKQKNQLLLSKIKERYRLTKNNNKPIVTYVLIAICVLMYIVKLFLSRNYDSTIVDVVLGGNYHTFTIGLRQFYRIFTCAFIHGSFMHLLSNMYSLYVLGRYIENEYGIYNYLLILFCSIFMGSICQLIFAANNVSIGMSSGLYGLMLVFIVDLISKRKAPVSTFLPLIFINISINFMSNIAWLAHLGGLIGGYLIYAYINSDKKLELFVLYFIFLILIFIKLFTIKKIDPLYKGSDLQILKMYNEIGFKKYAESLLNRLLVVYEKFGG